VALNACSDESPSISAPQQNESVRTSISALGGVPTGKTVVVFNDETSIPAGGLSLITSLGGTVLNRWDNVGVAFVTGLSLEALTSLRTSDLVKAVGNDRYVNWLPRTKMTPIQATDVLAIPHNDPAKASYYADGTQWNMKQIGANKAWAAGKQGLPSTRVAILDTGIDYGHREIRTLVDLDASASFTNATYHTGPVYVYVLEGAFTIDEQGKERRTFKPGELYKEPIGAPMQARNLSASKPLKLLVFQVTPEGEPLMVKAE
jgi:quercetin dioxygenase-like cupin family protein